VLGLLAFNKTEEVPRLRIVYGYFWREGEWNHVHGKTSFEISPSISVLD
jgi:hypothetical protein